MATQYLIELLLSNSFLISLVTQFKCLPPVAISLCKGTFMPSQKYYIAQRWTYWKLLSLVTSGNEMGFVNEGEGVISYTLLYFYPISTFVMRTFFII